VHVDNLERLKLCAITRPDQELRQLTQQLQKEPEAEARGVWPRPARLPRQSADATIAISALKAFVAACTPPQKKARSRSPGPLPVGDG
jgi:hypothetical protein